MSTKKPNKKPARREEGCAKHVGNDVLRECPFRDVCPCVEKIVYVPVYVYAAAPQLGQPWPIQPIPNQPLYPPNIVTCHGGLAP